MSAHQRELDEEITVPTSCSYLFMTGTSLSCIRLLGLVFWNSIHLQETHQQQYEEHQSRNAPGIQEKNSMKTVSEPRVEFVAPAIDH